MIGVLGTVTTEAGHPATLWRSRCGCEWLYGGFPSRFCIEHSGSKDRQEGYWSGATWIERNSLPLPEVDIGGGSMDSYLSRLKARAA